ncbi:Metacaspase type II [Mycena sanguinolenta]|uniref:Metacaspase type II n=1 Tax=Mycena sanguinolenta TaxID=230812 RepID=A0A8H6X5U4_9AGAR|nr:Metacaspase type II [Mycena sanguinolenta]
MDAGVGQEARIPSVFQQNVPVEMHSMSSPFPNDCTGQRRALLIGVSRSKAKGYDVLPTAHDDVYKMRDLLLEIYHYTPSQITVLVDDGIEGHVQPTRANILHAIGEFVKDVKAGDKLCFHYSGHSTQIESRANSEEDHMDECLIPLDGEMIVDNELHAALVKPLPSGSRLVAVLDTCNSGSLLDLPHYRCNRVVVPWIWRGQRNSEDLWSGVVRRNARVGSGPIANGGHTCRQRTNDQNEDYDKDKENLTTEDVGPVMPSISKLHRFLPDEAAHCDSPVGQWPCNGWCRNVERRLTAMEADEVKADVISLASCKDSQRAWEMDGVSMTCDVLVRVSHAMYSIALMRHSQAKAYKKDRKRYIAHLLRSIKQLERGNQASLMSPPGIAGPKKLVQVVGERITSLRQSLNKALENVTICLFSSTMYLYTF